MAKVKKDMEANVEKIKDNQAKAKNEKRLKTLNLLLLRKTLLILRSLSQKKERLFR